MKTKEELADNQAPIPENQEKKVAEKKVKEPKKNQQLKKLEESNAELQDKYLRTQAEMKNIIKRNEEHIARIYKYEGEDLVKKILTIVDNFERAFNMDDQNLDDEVSKFLSGFKMIYANLIQILKDMGVTEINCLNQEFDPTKMEAIMTESIVEEEPNTVIEVLQKGYMYNDKVIRVASVKVNE